MKVTLIKINNNTFETTYGKIDDGNIYKDKEIGYDADGVFIVCNDSRVSTIKYYERLLLREMIKSTMNGLNETYTRLGELNREYISLVNKLVN